MKVVILAVQYPPVTSGRLDVNRPVPRVKGVKAYFLNML